MPLARSLVCVVALLALAAPLGAQTLHVVYTPTDAVFPNPERGFYAHREAPAEGAALTDTDLQSLRRDANITLVLRLYYLKAFRNAPLSPAQLDLMERDFDTLRRNGLKAIVRLAYSSRENDPDAPLDVAIGHLDQLRPILERHADVIAVVQAGIIGAWGEWYYSTNGLNNTAARRAVTRAWLERLPADRMVQVRTPFYKKLIFERTTPLDEAEAYSGTDYARTGHHNDCFLASSTDYGTYENLAVDRAYLAADARFTPVGGETCNVNPPRSQCASALAELAQFHWSYLNRDYHTGVIGSWYSGGCIDEVKRRLGYRFALVDADVSALARPGGTFTLRLDVANEGWAAPFNPRGAEVVLRHRTTAERYVVPLGQDPRRWSPADTTTVTLEAGLPADLPEGAYEVLLFLPDARPTLRERPEYAIRLANDALWEAATGYNTLRADLSVEASAPGPAYTGARWFRPYDAYVTAEPPLADAADVLSTAYPNPFGASARFDVRAARSGWATVELFDVLGRRVATLFEGVLAAGETRTLALDAAALPPGLYVCVLRAGHTRLARTVVHVR